MWEYVYSVALIVSCLLFAAVTRVEAAEHYPAMPASIDSRPAVVDENTLVQHEARGHNLDALEGLGVKPAGGMKITMFAGKARVLDQEVAVPETTLEIAPARMLQVTVAVSCS